MQLHCVLQAHGRRSTPHVHFAAVLQRIGETLGGDGSPAPAEFQTPDLFAAQYLRYNLSRKASRLYGVTTDPCARKERTINGFLARECVNAVINAVRTWGYSSVTGEHQSDLLGDQLLYTARDIIRDILGERPNIDRILSRCEFGNGASATMKRTESQGPNKFLYGRSVTTRLRSFIAHAIRTSPAWSELTSSDPTMYVDSNGRHTLPDWRLATVAGSVLDVVEKTAEIDRVIMKEPELNGFVQKGIGSEIRHLLRKPLPAWGTIGIDLDHSGADNDYLARWGSVDGRVATVDGERASDSQTIALYEFLFPPLWFELLFMARSPYTIVDGKLHRLEMMGGMGNGFTFEAQSVIFYAVGLACAMRSKHPHAECVVSIHGDDLIVPADVREEVLLAYQAMGVVVNQSKSFFEGPFRESCGGHYFNGFDVKPFYVKAQDGRSRGDWFWLYNSLLLWLNRRGEDWRASPAGVELVRILRYLAWYASSGNILAWRVPCDSSRRSGIFSNPPKLRGGSWKTRMVCTLRTSSSLPEDGCYLSWLNKPRVTTVYDLLFPKRKPPRSLEVDTDVYEADRFVRLIAWADFSVIGHAAPLWLRDRGKSGL